MGRKLFFRKPNYLQTEFQSRTVFRRQKANEGSLDHSQYSLS